MKTPLSRSELGLWIAEHHPELDDHLRGRAVGRCRELLNQITGLDIKDTDSIQDSLPKYLARLKELSGK